MAAERRVEVLAGQIAAVEQTTMLSREETRGTSSEAHLEAMGEDAFAYAVPLPEKLTADGRWEVYR